LEEEVVTRGAKLVILDSVASLVRKEFDTGVRHNLAERSNMLTKIAAILKQTAECLSIPVSNCRIDIFISLYFIHWQSSPEHVALRGKSDTIGPIVFTSFKLKQHCHVVIMAWFFVIVQVLLILS